MNRSLSLGFRLRLVSLMMVVLVCLVAIAPNGRVSADGPTLDAAKANPHQMVSDDPEASMVGPSVTDESTDEDDGGLTLADPAAVTTVESESFEGLDVAAATEATEDDLKLLEEEAQFFRPVTTNGDATTSSVIGTDSRVRVNPTTSFPSRAIVHLSITWKNNTGGGCSGWMIGPRTVATAGHCVYDSSKGGWAKSITVTPGRNGATKPYGSTTARRLFSVSGWTSSASANYDYGAIQLNNSIGNTVGWFGFRYSTSNSAFNNLNVTVSGYPGDKPFGTMWRMSGAIRRVAERRFFYGMDTAGGQSGAPVYHNYSSTCSACGVAIHAYGVGGDPFGQYNSGTRITKAVFDNLRYWKNYP